jgi:DNA-binding winged helix-turn-helix (wHTH) protein/TolB-like protein
MDPDKQVLLRENHPIPVTPKAFETLLALVRRSRDVVSKGELLKEIWPDSFVEESNLSQNIFLLRKALGDTAENRQYIVTLPGRGYRFAAPVRTVTMQGEALVARVGTRTQIVIEENEAETNQALKPAPTPKTPKASRKFRLAMAVVAVLLALGAFLLIRSRRPANLGEKESILVADFVNTTGDPVFDDTLRQGMEVQLEQSPSLSLVSEDSIRQALGLMGQSPNTLLTGWTAREVCERTGSSAVLEGSIKPLGSEYVLDLRSVNCRTGEKIDDEQAQVARKEDALDAITRMARGFRARAGEIGRCAGKVRHPAGRGNHPIARGLEGIQPGLEGRGVAGRRSCHTVFSACRGNRPQLRNGLRLTGIDVWRFRVFGVGHGECHTGI